MEVTESSQQEDGSVARPKSERPREEAEADPRGFHELAFLGQSNACEAEPELEERDIGPEFDSYEDLDGDKLRLLDRWVEREQSRASARAVLVGGAVELVVTPLSSIACFSAGLPLRWNKRRGFWERVSGGFGLLDGDLIIWCGGESE